MDDLDDMIAEARREVAMRENVYPKWVASGRMKQATADRQLARMRNIAALLQRLKSEGYRV